MNLAGFLTYNSQPYEKFISYQGELEQYAFVVFYFQSYKLQEFMKFADEYDYAIKIRDDLYGKPDAEFLFNNKPSTIHTTLGDYLLHPETFANAELLEFDYGGEVASAIVMTTRKNNDMFLELASIAKTIFWVESTIDL